MTEPPTTQRVLVRIAVAVNSKCEWAAFGFSKNTDEEMKEALFIGDIADGEQFHWIEAMVPVPQEQTIEGKLV